MDPKLVRIGWYLLSAAVVLWIVGMIASPTSSPTDTGVRMPLMRMKVAFVLSILQILTALAAIPLVAPFQKSRRRRRPMRDWSLRGFLAVIVLTGLVQIWLLAEISSAQ